MTDADIIKALECCTSQDGSYPCTDCPCWDDDKSDCNGLDWKDVVSLVNRQKAEIERLTDLINEIAEANEDLVRDNHDLYVSLKKRDAEIERFSDIGKMYSEVRAEAIREFAERLLDKYDIWSESDVTEYQYVAELVNNLVKEMTEERQ